MACVDTEPIVPRTAAATWSAVVCGWSASQPRTARRGVVARRPADRSWLRNWAVPVGGIWFMSVRSEHAIWNESRLATRPGGCPPGKCGCVGGPAQDRIVGMTMGNYRRVLSLPGVRTLLVLMFASRIPVAATNMVLTLHVVLTLHRDYGAAGLVGAAGTVGIAIGAPLAGRLVDAIGLRKMVTITTATYGAYWLSAWLLPYPALLVVSFVGGVFALPVMSVGRQALAALVPPEHRKAAFSLDSISLEMSFMVGPAVGVLIATKVSTTVAVIAVGTMLVLAGIALYAVNPPVRGAHDEPETDGGRPPRRQWLRAPALAALAAGCGAVFVLAGTEVTMVAALRGVGEVSWTGVLTISMCVAS